MPSSRTSVLNVVGCILFSNNESYGSNPWERHAIAKAMLLSWTLLTKPLGSVNTSALHMHLGIKDSWSADFCLTSTK